MDGWVSLAETAGLLNQLRVIARRFESCAVRQFRRISTGNFFWMVAWPACLSVLKTVMG
jgi:hypothetical protein